MNDSTFALEAAAGTLRTWLDQADRILITAAAGLSAAAGYDYGDEDRFRELLPALHRLGLRSRYLVGVPLPPELWWGYWAVHIDDIRFSPAPNPLYQRLSSLVDGKDHWVMTSNVDALVAQLLATYDPATGAVTCPLPPRGQPPPGPADSSPRRPPAHPRIRRRIQHSRCHPMAGRTPHPAPDPTVAP
ncbi:MULTISPECIES: hypothetical protein [unclassified Streptomyces]|uniref:hypothetical protein n=1 Tax=unclassified Streptomyces TaxID=2593676 RepID=UPI003863ED96|nr:hypothetical protein OG569_18750 [Streptomyces sp. NBC_00827]